MVTNGDVENKAHRRDFIRRCVGIGLDVKEGNVYWTQKGPQKGAKRF